VTRFVEGQRPYDVSSIASSRRLNGRLAIQEFQESFEAAEAGGESFYSVYSVFCRFWVST
jgi:hypothetical protein